MAEQPNDTPEMQAAPAVASAAPSDAATISEAKAATADPGPTVAGLRREESKAQGRTTQVKVKGARPAAAAPSAAVAPSATAAPSLEPAARPAPAPATAEPVRRAVEPVEAGRRYPLRAAGVALAIGLGVAGGAYALSRPADDASGTAFKQWTEATGAALRQNGEDVTRVSGDVRALKVAVESLKEGLDRSKADAARGGPLAERLDRTDRATAEIAAKLGKLSEQLERVERGEKEGVAKVSLLHEAKAKEMSERFERLERQVQAAANTVAAIGSAPKPAPAASAAPAPVPEPRETASLAPKPDSKTAPVEGFVLREVYDGVALVEGRNNRLYEVGPGSNLPGVGRVESIERRGKTWAVLTPKGVIPMARW
jgi:hypothetical protein